MNSFYSADELKQLGLKQFGENVLISKKCSLYNATQISIGDNVRIDDFCILSGKITLGSHIHISAGAYLFAGDAGIEIADFSGLSGKCNVYAVSDDYSGSVLTNAMIDDEFRNVISQKIIFEKYVMVGAGTTILPGVILEEGVAIGAMSLVVKRAQKWKIYGGVPAKIISERKNDSIALAEKFRHKFQEFTNT